jgi:hypothetical protein
MNLADILTSPKEAQANASEVFALLALGVIESLSRGQIAPTEAVQTFFSAENCLFVRKRLKVKSADRLMSHGVQLPDLFDVLPAEEAHREFQHELESMRRLTLELLDTSRKSRVNNAPQPSSAS